MPALWSRTHHVCRMNVLLLCIITLGVYMVFFDPTASGQIPDDAIDLEEIEQELESGNPVRIVEKYKSPIDRILLDLPDISHDKYTRDFEFESDLARAYKYHKVWDWADGVISNRQLFPEVPEVNQVIDALSHARIVNVDILDIGDYESGTSEKWLVTLEGGQKAMMKLVWEEKGKMKHDGQCNFGFEMPWAEIAAFHLHRVIGFRNTPYVTGRLVDLKSEVLPVASPIVAKQIILKSANETCVVGKCFHCKEKAILCPPNGVVQVSLAYWIPRKIRIWTYPPKYMPFSTPRMKEWGDVGLNNRSYCRKVSQTIDPYHLENYFLDLMDFAVLDTLMYHYDSKHYTINDNSPAGGLTVRIDHGRSFCASDRDEEHIFIAPVFQCCKLRKSTWDAITQFRSGELSRKWRQAMASDPIAPIMHEDWFPAVERRLAKVIKTIGQCFDANKGKDNVLL